jgi:hypothetical protein
MSGYATLLRPEVLPNWNGSAAMKEDQAGRNKKSTGVHFFKSSFGISQTNKLRKFSALSQFRRSVQDCCTHL